MMTLSNTINYWDIVRWLETNGYRQYRDWQFEFVKREYSQNGFKKPSDTRPIGIIFDDPAVEMQVKLIWY